jgi:hypothetical protein
MFISPETHFATATVLVAHEKSDLAAISWTFVLVSRITETLPGFGRSRGEQMHWGNCRWRRPRPRPSASSPKSCAGSAGRRVVCCPKAIR